MGADEAGEEDGVRVGAEVGERATGEVDGARVGAVVGARVTGVALGALVLKVGTVDGLRVRMVGIELGEKLAPFTACVGALVPSVGLTVKS